MAFGLAGQRLGLGGLVAVLALCGGCSLSSVLNPDFLASVGLAESAANLPGEAPAMVIEVQNETNQIVEFRLTWRDGNGDIQLRSRRLLIGEKFSEVAICPISEVTIGDVSDLTATGAIVRLGNGDAADPFIEVEPFGVLLQDQINYNCGDSVTFSVRSSGETNSGFRLFAFIERSGATLPTTP